MDVMGKQAFFVKHLVGVILHYIVITIQVVHLELVIEHWIGGVYDLQRVRASQRSSIILPVHSNVHFVDVFLHSLVLAVLFDVVDQLLLVIHKLLKLIIWTDCCD